VHSGNSPGFLQPEVVRIDSMQSVATHTSEKHFDKAQPIVHVVEHVDEHSIRDAVFFGMKITIACCIPLGLFIGNDRAQGSYYAYGLSCFFWPMLFAVAIGAAIGSSLGYVFGVIGHASDPVKE
jgi:hypothetical protein